MLTALEIFLGYALYKFTFYLLTYLISLSYQSADFHSPQLFPESILLPPVNGVDAPAQFTLSEHFL